MKSEAFEAFLGDDLERSWVRVGTGAVVTITDPGARLVNGDVVFGLHLDVVLCSGERYHDDDVGIVYMSGILFPMAALSLGWITTRTIPHRNRRARHSRRI